ncbi:MAG: aminotransferase class I and II [Burkholderiales bacterium]|nr:aminotransferase class I and II [Burkholderiales bacterium]
MRTATRYVTPLREGGSLPALVEADDLGLYVLKFRGAGQGPKALIAEWVAGELARALGLVVPRIVLMQLDAELARTEPDAEIQDLVRASAGLNLALDFLPGAVTFDPLLHPPAPALASALVWFDAFVGNVDRTPRNSNLLVWHGRVWLIDHGAALTFHHQWGDPVQQAQRPSSLIAGARDHVLLPWAQEIAAADASLAPLLTPALVHDVLAQLPDSWLAGEPAFAGVAEHRAAYEAWFGARLAAREPLMRQLQEAQRAATQHV